MEQWSVGDRVRADEPAGAQAYRPGRYWAHVRRTWSLGGLGKVDLVRTVFHSCQEHDLPGRAAQLSFYFLLALFPLLIFLSAVLGQVLSTDQDVLNRLLGYVGSIMPWTAYELVRSTVQDIMEGTSGGKVSVGLVLALWTGSSGMVAIIEGLNVAYLVPEKRPWWRRRVVALILTICLGVLATLAMLLILAGDRLADLAASTLAPSFFLGATSALAQWIIALMCMLFALLIIYRFAPNLADQGVEAVLPGALVALAGWVFASSAFRIYLAVFDSFSRTYGSLGGVMVLLFWLYLTAASILVGGEVNSAIRAAAKRPRSIESL